MTGPASVAAAKQAMFQAFIDVLGDHDVPYCILAGYDDYPRSIESDVDFMVPESARPALPDLIREAAARSAAQFIQSIRHETTAEYFVIARLEHGHPVYLHPDSTGDYRRGGRLWLRADTVLERRRLSPGGFFVPAAADAFLYYLVKKIDKGELVDRHIRFLSRRYAEDPAGVSTALRSALPAADAATVEHAVQSGLWHPIRASLVGLKASLRLHARENALARLAQHWRDLWRRAQRIRHTTGMTLVFLGPDGSGKSAVSAQVCEALAAGFRRVSSVHLRPGVLTRRAAAGGPVTDPHGRPVRGTCGSIAKLAYFWLDYVATGVVWLFPRRVRSTLVVFDRYYHDLLVDPVRYRYGGPMWLARLLARCVPQPDLLFVLDAPPDTLQARKAEVSPAECERQRTAYRELARRLPCARVIDASRPLECVTHEVLRATFDALEARTASRLGLRSPHGSTGKESCAL